MPGCRQVTGSSRQRQRQHDPDEDDDAARLPETAFRRPGVFHADNAGGRVVFAAPGQLAFGSLKCQPRAA